MLNLRKRVIATFTLFAVLATYFLYMFSSREPELRRQSQTAYAKQEWANSFNFAAKRLKEDNGDKTARLLMARSAARLQKDAVALELYGQNSENEAIAEDLYLVGLILMRQGKMQSGENLIKRSMEIKKDYSEPLKFLSEFYFRNQQKASALSLNSQWIGFEPDHPDALLTRGKILDSLNEPKLAAEAFSRILALNDHHPDESINSQSLLKMTVRNLLRINQPDEAIQLLKSYGANNTPDPETLWLQSRVYLQKGLIPEAENYLNQYRVAIEKGLPQPDLDEPAPYAGAESCRSCHESIYDDQQNSRHAITFHRGQTGQKLPWTSLRKRDTHNPEILTEFDPEPVTGERIWRTQINNSEMQSLVQFIIGSGRHAITPILKHQNGLSLEARWTFYSSIRDWDLTPGQLVLPNDPIHHIGVPQSPDMLRICLECHTTNASAVLNDIGIERLDRGIGCERCHGPGGNHLAAMKYQFPDKAIGRFRRNSNGTRPQAMQMCAECHGTKGRDILQEGDAAIVRFQATTLTFSECYKKTEGTGAFDCLTCHSPHEDAESELTFYDEKCLKCHQTAQQKNVLEVADEQLASTCRIETQKNCTSCHMPKIDSIQPHAKFTDHQISIPKKQE
ncbi:MAG: hypothetical protein RJA81_2259 [Planctomycetota bacterium]